MLGYAIEIGIFIVSEVITVFFAVRQIESKNREHLNQVIDERLKLQITSDMQRELNKITERLSRIEGYLARKDGSWL